MTGVKRATRSLGGLRADLAAVAGRWDWPGRAAVVARTIVRRAPQSRRGCRGAGGIEVAPHAARVADVSSIWPSSTTPRGAVRHDAAGSVAAIRELVRVLPQRPRARGQRVRAAGSARAIADAERALSSGDAAERSAAASSRPCARRRGGGRLCRGIKPRQGG
jgi:hypothetical protein